MRPMIEYVKNNLPGPLIGAEIGVAGGSHAMDIFKNLDLTELHLIDIWEKYEENNRIEERYYQHYDRVVKLFQPFENVKIYRQPSIEAVKEFEDNYFDFVYIDGNHDQVKQDIYAWLPKVKVGGILGGHDYTSGWQAVVDAVNECRTELIEQGVRFEWQREYPDWMFLKS